MRRIALIMFIYGVVAGLAEVVRPFCLPPPESVRDAREEIVGRWFNSRESRFDDYEEEIEFHADCTFHTILKRNGDEWPGQYGFFSLDTAWESGRHRQIITVSLNSSGKIGFYFTRSDALRTMLGRTMYVRSRGWKGWMLWLVVIPSVLSALPVCLIWRSAGAAV